MNEQDGGQARKVTDVKTESHLMAVAWRARARFGTLSLGHKLRLIPCRYDQVEDGLHELRQSHTEVRILVLVCFIQQRAELVYGLRLLAFERFLKCSSRKSVISGRASMYAPTSPAACRAILDIPLRAAYRASVGGARYAKTPVLRHDLH